LFHTYFIVVQIFGHNQYNYKTEKHLFPFPGHISSLDCSSATSTTQFGTMPSDCKKLS